MKLDRHFDTNYYKHKNHKYVSRERLGGYDLVKKPGSHRKTRAYRYKYTYAKTASPRNDTARAQKYLATYKKLQDDITQLQAERFRRGLVGSTQAMRQKEEKMKQLFNQLPRREQLTIEYKAAITKLFNIQGSSYRPAIKQAEDEVLAIATELGMYHPKSKFWFKRSNERFLQRLHIQRDS